MIDDSCEVPRQDLDDGFNPCRKQVVENGELRSYAHMYDVMNERYDREEDTSYLNSVKRDKITSTTPVLVAGNNTQIYANSTNGEGRVNMLPSSAFINPDNHTEASIPTAKAVADYVTANTSALEAEIDGKLDKVDDTYITDRLYGVSSNGTQFMKNISADPRNIASGHKDLQTAGSIADYVPIPLPVSKGGTGAQTRSLKSVDGLTLLPVIDSIGDSGALNGYTSVTDIATFITTNNIRPEITTALENYIADSVASNGLLPTNALMMDYVDGGLINYNSIVVSGGGTSKLVYNKVRLKNNRIYGDCCFTVVSEGGDGGVEVYIKINGTDINIPPAFTKFILSNKPMLVHKSSNTIIEGKNINNITDGTVYIQFNIGDFNTGEFIFIVDSVFTGYNQPM